VVVGLGDVVGLGEVVGPDELVGGGFDELDILVVVLIVVLFVVVGFGGLGGLVPPFVGVSAWLPSQYTVGPSNAKFFNMLLMRVVPGPVQRLVLAAAGFKGLGYSTWKTGLPSAKKLLYRSHSLSEAHCSLTAKSMIGARLSTMSMLFLRPIFMLYFAASFCIHCTYSIASLVLRLRPLSFCWEQSVMSSM